jgi:hypothetical protein
LLFSGKKTNRTRAFNFRRKEGKCVLPDGETGGAVLLAVAGVQGEEADGGVARDILALQVHPVILVDRLPSHN